MGSAPVIRPGQLSRADKMRTDNGQGSEMSKRNIIKWHYITEYHSGRVAGLRGWDSRLEERYEMSQTEDPLIWRCCVVNAGAEGEWFPSQIHEGGLLDCMVAAEYVADKRYESTSDDGIPF